MFWNGLFCGIFTLVVQLLFFRLYAIENSHPSPLGRISARGQWLVDSSGRIRLFHGANSVVKEFPWFDPQALNETRLKYYKSWGFNVIRLGTMWSGLQPSEGAYNQTYIDVLKRIVDKFAQYGIYSLLDVHQDGLSSKFTTYDGIPPWVFEKLPKPKNKFPWPFKGNKTSSWWEVYLTAACGFAFQSFYDNKGKTLDYFLEMWKQVASLFKTTTSVIGYELINEPWAGDVYGDPLIVLPGIAGKYNLKPMYDRLNGAIREVDNDTLIFFEPTTTAVVFNDSILGTGFDSPPGGAGYNNRSVLAWHYYCWIINGAHIDPYTGWKRDICDEVLGPQVFKSIREDSGHLSIPTFLTEFGLCAPDNSNTSKGTIECEYIMKQADDNLVSWTYWDSQFFSSSGSLDMSVAKAFARVYVRAVAGFPTFMNFNATTFEFHFRYIVDASIGLPTEIFIPRIHFPKGFSVVLSSGLSWSWDESSSCVLVKLVREKVLRSSREVFVSILPK